MNEGQGILIPADVRRLRNEGGGNRSLFLLFILSQGVLLFFFFRFALFNIEAIPGEESRYAPLIWQQELPGYAQWSILNGEYASLLTEARRLIPSDDQALHFLMGNLPGYTPIRGALAIDEDDIYYHHDESPSLDEVVQERDVIPIEQLQIIIGENNLQVERDRDKSFLSKKAPIFIYHTHNRESWFPYLPDTNKSNQAFHPEINVTLLGRYLQNELATHGIDSILSDVDYIPLLDSYQQSYEASRKTVEAALAQNEEILYLFDIHRDGISRDISTVEIGGESYARVMFVIGAKNPQWEKNQAFAQRMHQAIEAEYPGLSRGVMVKQAHEGNAEYNQSLHPQLLLLEIGGVENTLEESYRTLNLLARIIASFYWDAVPVHKNEGYGA